MMIAQCVEMELSTPIPVPDPSTSKFGSTNIQKSLRDVNCLNWTIARSPFLISLFFSGEGKWPIIRNNHPIKLRSELVPVVDTPMSPPLEDKGPSYNSFLNYTVYAEPKQSSFQGLERNGNGPLANCSDCVIFWKTTMQIQREAKQP